MEGYYIVFERPHLQEFLSWLFANYNVSVWTAASKDYALFVIRTILLAKPGRDIDYIFFDYHCKLSKRIFNKNTKDLRLLFDVFNIENYMPSNTIIIDDYDHVIETNPDNSIQVEEFNLLDAESECDNVLLDIQAKIQQAF
jgi:TFIIF-interacting CTD phosphatase-like protein